MSESTLPQLAGKVVSVKHGSGEQDYVYMEKPRFEVQGDRLFLTGVTLNETGDGADDLRVCVAWDSITAYYVFRSVEHCNACLAKWGAKENASWFRR